MKPFRLQVIVLTALAATVGAQGQVPGIIKAPQGTSVLVGSPINLSVQGSGGTPLTYQWLLDSKAIAAAKAQTYSLSNIQKTNEGDYQVVLSNSSGSVTSAVARVNVVIADILESPMPSSHTCLSKAVTATSAGTEIPAPGSAFRNTPKPENVAEGGFIFSPSRMGAKLISSL